MANASVYLMDLPNEQFVPLLGRDRNDDLPPLMNSGVVGQGLTIRELASTPGLAPRAEFHCLKLDPARAETLMRKFGSFPRVHVVQAALGDVVGKARININVSCPTNSL